MSKTQIPTGGIADDAISEEHLDATAITSTTALAAQPASTDEFLISDAGTLKRLDATHMFNTPAVMVHNANAQTLSTGTATKIVFDTESNDSDGEFASNKWTAGTAGRYLFICAVEMQSMGDAKENWLKVYKNGSAMVPTFTQFSGAGGYSNHITLMVNASATDYFEIYALQNNGNNRDISAESAVWSITRVIGG